MSKIEKKFLGENGEVEKIIISSDDKLDNNMGGKKYKLANNTEIGKELKKQNAFTSDIGFRSEGFARVAMLAAIVAFAGVVVAFIVLRF